MANEGRRYPANLNGILAFCTENTKSEDAPSSENVFQMDDEVKLFIWAAENCTCYNNLYYIFNVHVHLLI